MESATRKVHDLFGVAAMAPPLLLMSSCISFCDSENLPDTQNV